MRRLLVLVAAIAILAPAGSAHAWHDQCYHTAHSVTWDIETDRDRGDTIDPNHAATTTSDIHADMTWLCVLRINPTSQAIWFWSYLLEGDNDDAPASVNGAWPRYMSDPCNFVKIVDQTTSATRYFDPRGISTPSRPESYPSEFEGVRSRTLCEFFANQACPNDWTCNGFFVEDHHYEITFHHQLKYTWDVHPEPTLLGLPALTTASVSRFTALMPWATDSSTTRSATHTTCWRQDSSLDLIDPC